MIAPREPGTARGSHPLALAAALLLLIFGTLPLANWIPGGHAAPWYGTVTSVWTSGAAIVLGSGLVLAIASRRLPALWREGLGTRVAQGAERRPWLLAAILAVGALALYLWIARDVFSARPLFIDELAQVVQARIFAAGRLWHPAARHPEFFSALHLVDANGKEYSQFPPGGPALLALGALVDAPWIVGPVCGAVAVLAFWSYLRVAEPRVGVALGALVLFAFAPFMAFMAGSHMNHTPTLMLVLLAMAAMARVVASKAPRPVLAFASGLALGGAAAVRPVDALAFALPAGAWYLARAVRDRARWSDLLAAGAGVALPLAALLVVNARTTGHPLLFGYELLWGKAHGIGFHRAPWGMVHTPARGVELANLYLLRLETYLFEAPIPSLLPAAVALLLARRLDAFDRYLLASSALLVGLYFAYWHDGFYLGPRFVFLLLPLLALWTARLLPLVRERFGTGLGLRATVYGGLVAAALAATMLVPLRAAQYRAGLQTMRWNADSAAAASGARHALVLVRESWGAQLVARMGALGVPRSETEELYWHVDACRLEHGIAALERENLRDTAAYLALRPLLVDSARTVASPFSADTTERWLPGTEYSPRCRSRLAADRDGFTLYMPLRLARGGDDVYARDLHERDTLLLAEYPDRPVFLLRPASSAAGAMPRFYPLSRDSLLRAWRADAVPLTIAAGTPPASPSTSPLPARAPTPAR